MSSALRTSMPICLLLVLASACASTHSVKHGQAGESGVAAGQEAGDTLPGNTRVVLLGTGTPNPDPARSGPAVAVVVNDVPYLVDFGTGVVRRSRAAAVMGVTGLAPKNLNRAFLTHLHSDHTLGYADLILTPWVMGREQALEVYGPPGLDAMTRHILKAYEQDIHVRSVGNQPSTPDGYKVNVHEVEPGLIYQDENVKVIAFLVQHGAWEIAFGYRFETEDRTVVISGDTVGTESIVTACNGCDVLVHEVYSEAGFAGRSPEWQTYHAASHTSAVELGKIAARARPGLLVLTHQLQWGASEEQTLAEIRQNWSGKVVLGNDLDLF